MSSINTKEENPDTLQAIYRTDAIYVNKFYIQMLEEGNNFRITLGEENPDTNVVELKQSFLLSTRGFNQLGASIIQIVQHVQAQKQQKEKTSLDAQVQRNREATDIE